VFLTEFLCGDSDPLVRLFFCAREVPNLRVSYTGSTLLQQARTKKNKKNVKKCYKMSVNMMFKLVMLCHIMQK